jgi:hypothetical protein
MIAAVPSWVESAWTQFENLAYNLGRQDWLLTVVWLLLLALLLAPSALYLTRGWAHRRADVLSSLSPRAAALYLRNFQATDQKAREDLDRALAGWDRWDSLRAAEARLRELRQAPAAGPAVAEHEAAIRAQEAEVARLRAAAPGAGEIEKQFRTFYDDRFGRRRFFWPSVLLLALAAFLLSFPMADAECARAHMVDCPPPVGATGKAAPDDWRWVIGFAILGGYIRVVYELTLRYYQDNIRPADLLWFSYRLIISPPMGYAVAILLGGESTRAAYATAFLLGLFPTSTVTTLGRRMFAKATQTPDADTDQPAQLREVPALDPVTTQLLTEEGISTYTQLAYADPVRLTIRTGLGYSFIVTSVSEALLLGYLTTKDRMEIARQFGIAGAYEAANLWADAQGPDGDLARGQADRIIAELANRLGMTNEGLRNTLAEVANDPYLQFVAECWASNFTRPT